MIAKNKGDFLYNLHNELHRIGIDNDEEIFADFEEHFKASQEQGFSEEETCEKLGDVKEIARNYLDIESTRLNSIVASAISNQQQRVSLTKPGMDVPADISLIKDQQPEQPAQPPIREYTPEHIAQEQTARSVSGAIPQQTNERSQNVSASRQGEVPPQTCAPAGSGKGGFKFKDLKGMKPDVNASKLIGCLVMDVFLWSWLLPMVGSLICAFAGSVVLGLLTGGFAQLENDYFHLLSRIFLCSGMVSGAVLCGCACAAMVKGYIHWIRSIVISHVKAIYDL